MLSWSIAMTKALHVTALIAWCSGLLGLPLLLRHHDVGVGQLQYMRFRRMTHYGYIGLMTPAAVIAVSSGTALVFLRGVFEPWLFLKLVAVGVMVALHAWIGHVVLRTGETAGRYRVPMVWPAIVGLLLSMSMVLVLVLLKPALPLELGPAPLNQPLQRQLPLLEVPI